MAVHIFAVSKENYDICVDCGLVAIPGPKDSRNQDIVFDALSSRLSGINEDDYILMYRNCLGSLRRIAGQYAEFLQVVCCK